MPVIDTINELKGKLDKRFNNHAEKYPEKRYQESFGYVKEYAATVTKRDQLPAVTLVFKNKYRAKCFLYWVQLLSGVNRYQASVYLEDTVEEIYSKVK